LREIYFRLKPIETDEYTFYAFESVCFKGICALNRRHNLADAVQSDRANPLFLGGGGCSFLSSPQFFLFFVVAAGGKNVPPLFAPPKK